VKRSLTMLLVLGLIVGSLVGTAEAKKKKKKVKRIERVVEITYNGPNAGVSTPAATGGVCQLSTDEPGACIETPTSTKDRYVKITVTDASGQAVAGSISQGDTDGDGVSNIYGQFCGETPAALPLAAPGVPLRVTAYAGTCADGSTPSVMTTGTITLTFSNLP
jgi:hypothetical protein